jgi:uncharacterized protein DUF4232
MNMSHRLNRVSKVSLAAAVACLSTLGYQATASATNSVVPWLNQPTAGSALAPAAPAPAQHACSASDLKVVPGQQGARRGYATQEIRITNRSTESCYLLGAPSLELHHPDATVETVSPATALAAVAQQRLDLAPDDDAYLLIGTPGACEAAIRPERKVATRMKLFPRGGGDLTLDGVHLDTLCGPAQVLQMEVVQDEPKQAAKAAAKAAAAGKSLGLRELTGALTAPESVARGETLRYTVTLTNPTNAAIKLAPCPSYTQSLYTEGRTQNSTYLLNCAGAAGQIPARSSVSFAMEAVVPADMTGPGVKLSWNLQDALSVGGIIPLK